MKNDTGLLTLVVLVVAVILLVMYGKKGYGYVRNRIKRTPGQKLPKPGTAAKGNDSGGVLTNVPGGNFS